jgi:CGNR zinc finger protein
MARAGLPENGEGAPDPRPAPPDLEVLRRFVNSDNRFYGVDHLRGEDRADWFPEVVGLPVDEVDDAGWRRLAVLRDRVRAVVGTEDEAMVALAEAAQRYPLVLGPSGLAPARDDQESALAAAVLAALHAAHQDGRLARLRLCRRPDCQWCYYDTSKNGSARWCSADPCGDVMKARAYRSRQRGAG